MENSPLLWDLVDLASQLRQERLFVESEKAQLAKLNQEVRFSPLVFCCKLNLSDNVNTCF